MKRVNETTIFRNVSEPDANSVLNKRAEPKKILKQDRFRNNALYRINQDINKIDAIVDKAKEDFLKNNVIQKADESFKKLDNLAEKAKSEILQSFNKPSEDENVKKIDALAKMTTNQIYKISAVFPFDLFPNHIIIEQKQIIIRYRQFFFTHQDYHILISDILMPVVEVSIFFATLKLEIGEGGFQQNPPPVKFLFKKEALKAKRIIAGLLICLKENIDLSEMTREDVLRKIEEIGRFNTK